MKILTIVMLSLTIFLMACGEGEVTIDPSKYEVKIVIDGYLYPNQTVDRIKISRNLPIGTNISKSELAISDAVVVITDLNVTPNESYILTFNQDSLYYYDDGNNLNIQYGGEYRIEVQATVDGKPLEASSTTKVPLAGFTIFDSVSTHQIYFSDISQSGTLPRPVIYFNRSDQTCFKLFFTCNC